MGDWPLVICFVAWCLCMALDTKWSACSYCGRRKDQEDDH